MEELLSFLRQLRERAGLSQIELGHRAGLSETYYGKIEGGERRPSATVLMKVLAALNCSAEEMGLAVRMFAMRRFPLTFIDGLAGALPPRPPTGPTVQQASPVGPSRKRAARRRPRLAVWLLAASGLTLSQPLGVAMARPITSQSGGILLRSRGPTRWREAA